MQEGQLFAFRCKTCGHLETSDQAAESPHPVSCAVCGAGVSFHTVTGIRTINKDNWQHLAKLTSVELGALQLRPWEIEAHVPWPKKENTAKQVSVEAHEYLGQKDSN